MFSLNKLNFRKKYIEMPQKKNWTFFDTFTLEKLSSYSLSHALFQLNMQKILIFDVQTKERVELPPLKKYFSSFLVSLSDWYFNITRVGQWLRSQIPEDPGSNAITVIEKLFTACKKRRKRGRKWTKYHSQLIHLFFKQFSVENNVPKFPNGWIRTVYLCCVRSDHSANYATAITPF